MPRSNPFSASSYTPSVTPTKPKRRRRSASGGGVQASGSKVRYGRKQSVDRGTRQRTLKRLERLAEMGVDIGKLGGYGGGGFTEAGSYRRVTGGMARRVKAALRRRRGETVRPG
jgi:hypothetical protein